MYAGYPDLYMQFSKKNKFIFQPDWYRGVEYPKEQESGYASNEDLYVPGYFEMDIKKGETIVFAASTSEIKTSGLKKLFDKEVDERSPRDNFFHCLVNAAHQFHRRERTTTATSWLVIHGSSAVPVIHSFRSFRVLPSPSRKTITLSW